MDNQFRAPQPQQAQAAPQQQQPMQAEQQTYVEPMAPVVTMRQKPKSTGKTVTIIILILMLLGGGGYLGYTYKTTNDSLKSQSQKLSVAYAALEAKQLLLDGSSADETFVAKYNTAELSKANCSGKPLGMFDVHVNDKYVVYRYLCADTVFPNPIRVAAFQMQTDGTYKFTYGASTIKPNELPSYIYDSEPDFFATYKVTRV